MNKVEFKKNFDIGYKEIMFSANDGETFIVIKNDYSVPSSKVTSSITRLNGKRFEEVRWGFFFKDIEEIEDNVQAYVSIRLDKYDVDPEEFDDEEFIEHLIEEASEKIMETHVSTVLKEMEVI